MKKALSAKRERGRKRIHITIVHTKRKIKHRDKLEMAQRERENDREVSNYYDDKSKLITLTVYLQYVCVCVPIYVVNFLKTKLCKKQRRLLYSQSELRKMCENVNMFCVCVIIITMFECMMSKASLLSSEICSNVISELLQFPVNNFEIAA